MRCDASCGSITVASPPATGATLSQASDCAPPPASAATVPVVPPAIEKGADQRALDGDDFLPVRGEGKRCRALRARQQRRLELVPRLQPDEREGG